MARNASTGTSVVGTADKKPGPSAKIAERLAMLGIPEDELTPAVNLAVSALLEKLDDMGRDLSRTKESLSEIERLVDVDCVAPIPNRRAFMRRLSWAITMYERYGHPSTILYFDINDFKQINDQYGHAAGDIAIRHISQMLSTTMRESDFLARIGGDEFAVIMYYANEEAARMRGGKIAEQLQKTPFVFNGQQLHITTAYGYYSIKGGDDAEAALASADMSMYVDKKAGEDGKLIEVISSMFTRLLFILVAMALGVSNAQAAEKIVTIGTAGVTGVYYPAGGAICRLVNRGRKEHGIRCMVESTGGSINNLESIRKGDLDLGVVQSDLLYQAYNGSEVFSDVGADKNLRVVFALHAEPFTVVARQDAKIKTFDDLKGKRVYMGAPGSGMRATMEDLMKHKGWTNKSFEAVDVKPSDEGKALCTGQIDALVFSGGHPNGTIQQITGMCATHLVDVSGPVIDKLIAEHPFYTRAIIPGGMYVGNAKDIKTFGERAVLVAPANLDDEVVYQVVKAVMDNLDNFKTLHPVFATLSAREMAQGVNSVPIHSGALKYYKEKGLAE